MRIGKVELDGDLIALTIIPLSILVVIVCCIISVGKLDMEKEKTEQLRIELEIEQQKNSRGRV